MLNFLVYFRGAMARNQVINRRDREHTQEEAECFNRRLGKLRKKSFISFRVTK